MSDTYARTGKWAGSWREFPDESCRPADLDDTLRCVTLKLYLLIFVGDPMRKALLLTAIFWVALFATILAAQQ